MIARLLSCFLSEGKHYSRPQPSATPSLHRKNRPYAAASRFKLPSSPRRAGWLALPLSFPSAVRVYQKRRPPLSSLCLSSHNSRSFLFRVFPFPPLLFAYTTRSSSNSSSSRHNRREHELPRTTSSKAACLLACLLRRFTSLYIMSTAALCFFLSFFFLSLLLSSPPLKEFCRTERRQRRQQRKSCSKEEGRRSRGRKKGAIIALLLLCRSLRSPNGLMAIFPDASEERRRVVGGGRWAVGAID